MEAVCSAHYISNKCILILCSKHTHFISYLYFHLASYLWLVLFISYFVCPAVLHSVKHFITASTGIPIIPEFVLTIEVDELLVGYCDSNKKVDVKQDITKSFFAKYPEQFKWYKQRCVHFLPDFFKSDTHSLMSLYNQSGGTVCNMLYSV